MKKILALLASIVLFLSPCVAQQSGTAIAVDPTGRLAFLNTNSLGQIFLAQAGPGITNAQSGVAVALNPSGTLAYLNVDSTGGLIVSGGGTVKSVALTAPGNFTVTGSPVTASGTLGFGWTGLTTNGILQANNSTTVGSTLTPSGLTSLGVNGLLSAAISPLTLGTGTFGTAVTFASATGIPTFATGAVFNGAFSGITTCTFTPASGGTATTTPGIINSNTTLSTSGATVQYSPSLQLIGHAWNTAATPADNYVQAREELRPVSGPSPTGTLAWSFSTSATSTPTYADAMTLASGGYLFVSGGIEVNTSIGNAQILNTNGATAPPYAFYGFSTTGLYAAAPGIGFSVAAASVGTWTATGLNVVGNITTTLPIQYGGLTRTTAPFTATSNTVLANITGLTVNVVAGKTYMFRVWAPTTATTAGGVQFAIAGTATATYITYEGNLESAGVFTQTRAAALAAPVCSSSTATVGTANITGSITVNAGGTLTVQFAQATSNAAASTVLQGSYFEVWQTSN